MSGDAGQRFSLPHGRVMIHQPSHSIRGRTTDVEIAATEAERTKATLVRIIAQQTGKDDGEIRAMLENDYHLTPEQARELKVIDGVVSSSEDVFAKEGSGGGGGGATAAVATEGGEGAKSADAGEGKSKGG
mmetsp:Transcript_25341/g.83295  ORF Transcript_25341/g.83295 Transcript_25341/m.83295 type:complete len:131 (+) Transcript_25341:824-1216(+)